MKNITKFIAVLVACMAMPAMAAINPKLIKLSVTPTVTPAQATVSSSPEASSDPVITVDSAEVWAGDSVTITPAWADGSSDPIECDVRVKGGPGIVTVVMNGTATDTAPKVWPTRSADSNGAPTGDPLRWGTYFSEARLSDSTGAYITGPNIRIAALTSSTTQNSAPNGTADTRTTIGVCEKVDLEAEAPDSTITWLVNAGGTVTSTPDGKRVTLEASETPTTQTLTATLPNGQSRTFGYTVIKPTGMTYSKKGHRPFPLGTVGAHMLLEMALIPSNVSFGNIDWREMGGALCPAENVEGWWIGRAHDHGGNQDWLAVNDDNTLPGVDQVGTLQPGLPWTNGSGTFTWNIPIHYVKRDTGTTGGTGHLFTTVAHVANISSSGNDSQTKGGQSCFRYTNGLLEVPQQFYPITSGYHPAATLYNW